MTTIGLSPTVTPRRFTGEVGLLVGRGVRMLPRVPERLLDVTLQVCPARLADETARQDVFLDGQLREAMTAFEHLDDAFGDKP